MLQSATVCYVKPQSAVPAKPRRASALPQRQLNIRIDPAFYQAIESLARKDRRSVAQTATHLLEDGLRGLMNQAGAFDDTPGTEVAGLAAKGGAFAWLADEPDLYDDTCGEPL